jgi:hypothetical protein
MSDKKSLNCNVLEFIFTKFERFIRRSLLPSTTLLLPLGFIQFYHDKASLEGIITSLETSMLGVFLIAVLAIGYLLKLLHQALFDNFIKGDYDAFLLFREETKRLKELRKIVLEKLQEEYPVLKKEIIMNDFLLYQIVGKILEDDIDTKRYATDAKETGITFISIMIIMGVLLYSKSIILLIAVWIVLLFFGRELVKSKYRSRAFRLYATYLLKEKIAR